MLLNYYKIKIILMVVIDYIVLTLLQGYTNKL